VLHTKLSRGTRRWPEMICKVVSICYGIVLHIQSASDKLLTVEEGSLYPALHRMEMSGWICSEWKLTETGRKAKYYRLTKAGQKELEKAEKSFEQLVKGIRAILRYA
jgi:PadR family transcriptional regulator, regulatory protein PadR